MRDDTRSLLGGLFILSAALFNFPVIDIIEAVANEWGWVSTTVLVLLIWLMIIGATAWVVERSGD